MARIEVSPGVTLEYEVAGSGEPVVLVHGSFIAAAFAPLTAEPALSGRYRLISYTRRGYEGSTPTTGVVSVEQQAADLRGLLSALGIGRAHVVGHSYGGCVALQLALDAAELVQSIALIEPALGVGASAGSYRQSLLQTAERFRTAGAQVALDEALSARWPDYRPALDRALPGAFDRALADAGASFLHERPGLVEWTFGEAEARRIVCPVLAVIGGRSEALWPRFGETQRCLLEWLPDGDGFVVPGATHFLHVEAPGVTAEALASFFARHPMHPGSP